MLLILLGIAAILIPLGGYLYLKFREPIAVSPKRITHTTKEWSERIPFTIYNRSDEAIYNIWIKLLMVGIDIDFKDIELQPKFGGKFQKIDLSNFTANFDIMRFDCLDNCKKDSIYLLLRDLNPQTTKPLTINIKASKSENNQILKIFLQIKDYSKEGARVLTRKNDNSYPFTPPENIKLKTITVYRTT